ncbi:unnamed protein product [Rotaria sordida]|uniref:Oxidoreductase n=1 Tax=Rotaria sordida TaxID=392033 RepID=A0A814ZA48_9BILA|nr:unnamed protein product [Rotaria sordida]CAF1240861.1 unnamed protein product [Rotaria sordida]CAF1522080.1 unnamed protein product [Rotaria sordida]CAF1523113.1 unnamed protein product [Rotaria sordida]
MFIEHRTPLSQKSKMASSSNSMKKLRMGMIGGGPGAFIGAVHRTAACLDGEIELVCGAFSSDPEKSYEMGKQLGLPTNRVYGSYKEMIEQEQKLGGMDFVAIVTPNHIHYEPAVLALRAGFDVVLDKPICFSLDEARQLSRIVNETGRTLCLTHTYTGYPMVKQARQMIARNDIGLIRKVYVEYPQGWLSRDTINSKQAKWRLDPKQSGLAGCLGDIGIHVFNLAEYITGLQVTHVCADLRTVVQGRQLDDDASVLLRFNNGANGVLMASQICAGEENNLKIRVYGENGSIEWQHANCNTLTVRWLDSPAEIYRTGTEYLSQSAIHNARVPAGHPEGYIEAFANIYRNFGRTIRAKKNGETSLSEEWKDFPGVKEGIRGMAFIETCVANSKNDNEKWTELKE